MATNPITGVPSYAPPPPRPEDKFNKPNSLMDSTRSFVQQAPGTAKKFLTSTPQQQGEMLPEGVQKAGRGVVNAIGEMGASMVEPKNIPLTALVTLTAGTGLAPAIVMHLIKVGFTVGGIEGLAQTAPAAVQAFKQGNDEEGWKQLTHSMANAGMIMPGLGSAKELGTKGLNKLTVPGPFEGPSITDLAGQEGFIQVNFFDNAGRKLGSRDVTGTRASSWEPVRGPKGEVPTKAEIVVTEAPAATKNAPLYERGTALNLIREQGIDPNVQGAVTLTNASGKGSGPMTKMDFNKMYPVNTPGPKRAIVTRTASGRPQPGGAPVTAEEVMHNDWAGQNAAAMKNKTVQETTRLRQQAAAPEKPQPYVEITQPSAQATPPKQAPAPTPEAAPAPAAPPPVAPAPAASSPRSMAQTLSELERIFPGLSDEQYWGMYQMARNQGGAVAPPPTPAPAAAAPKSPEPVAPPKEVVAPPPTAPQKSPGAWSAPSSTMSSISMPAAEAPKATPTPTPVVSPEPALAPAPQPPPEPAPTPTKPAEYTGPQSEVTAGWRKPAQAAAAAEKRRQPKKVYDYTGKTLAEKYAPQYPEAVPGEPALRGTPTADDIEAFLNKPDPKATDTINVPGMGTLVRRVKGTDLFEYMPTEPAREMDVNNLPMVHVKDIVGMEDVVNRVKAYTEQFRTGGKSLKMRPQQVGPSKERVVLEGGGEPTVVAATKEIPNTEVAAQIQALRQEGKAGAAQAGRIDRRRNAFGGLTIKRVTPNKSYDYIRMVHPGQEGPKPDYHGKMLRAIEENRPLTGEDVEPVEATPPPDVMAPEDVATQAMDITEKPEYGALNIGGSRKFKESRARDIEFEAQKLGRELTPEQLGKLAAESGRDPVKLLQLLKQKSAGERARPYRPSRGTTWDRIENTPMPQTPSEVEPAAKTVNTEGRQPSRQLHPKTLQEQADIQQRLAAAKGPQTPPKTSGHEGTSVSPKKGPAIVEDIDSLSKAQLKSLADSLDKESSELWQQYGQLIRRGTAPKTGTPKPGAISTEADALRVKSQNLKRRADELRARIPSAPDTQKGEAPRPEQTHKGQRSHEMFVESEQNRRMRGYINPKGEGRGIPSTSGRDLRPPSSESPHTMGLADAQDMKWRIEDLRRRINGVPEGSKAQENLKKQLKDLLKIWPKLQQISQAAPPIPPPPFQTREA